MDCVDIDHLQGTNLIIGAATGYSPKGLVPFIRSARRHIPDCHLVLFSEQRIERVVMACDVDRKYISVLRPPHEFVRSILLEKLPRFSKFLRSLLIHSAKVHQDRSGIYPSRRGVATLNVTLARYFWALEIAKRLAHRFSNVALSDTRDVVFQSNFFTKSPGRSLVTGTEPKTIADCKWTRAWVRACYPELLGTLLQKPVICSGFTFGPSDIVLNYLITMCRSISALGKQQLLGKYYDQAVHIKVLNYDNSLSDVAVLTTNEEGVIAHLSYQPRESVRYRTGANVVTVGGQTPSVVHQYDRHAKLAAKIRNGWELC
jgi:hypothetical protein